MLNNDDLDKCSSHYEACCQVVKDAKDFHESEWQLKPEEQEKLYECAPLMDKNNRMAEKYGPNSEESNNAFGEWLDCFVKKTCKKGYSSLFDCIKKKGNQSLCEEEGHILVECASRMTIR